MKKAGKIFVLLAFLVLMLAMVSGCGKKNTVTIDKDTIYREEQLSISFPDGFEVDRMMLNGDRLFFMGYIYNNVTYETKQCWGNVKTDGTDMVFNDFKPNDSANSYIDRMCITDDGNVIIRYSSYTEVVDGEDYYTTSEQKMDLYKPDGKLVKSVDLTEVCGENDWIQDVQCINGKIVIFLGQKKLIYSPSLDFEKEIKLDTEEYNDSFIKISDNSYVVSAWDEEGQALYKFDNDKLSRGEKIEIPFSFYTYSIMSGGKSGYDILLRDTTKILGYKFGEAEPKTIINFVDSDIYSSYFNLFDSIGNNEFIGASADWSNDKYEVRICKYTKVNPEDVVDKKVITLGCLYIWDSLKRDVIEFNKTNPDYRISMIDYESFNSMDDWEAGQKRFNSDIVSGKGPDIIVANNSDMLMQYAGKGLFADLNKYLDKDEEINKDDFFPNVLETCSMNGKLYALAPVFYVNTALAKTSVVGDRVGWTIQEMIDFEKTLSEGSRMFDYSTRSLVLSNILGASGDSFINEKEAKCNFNSPEFIALLEYLKDQPEEINYGDGPIMYDMAIDDDYATKWRNNKVILAETTFSDIRSFNYYEQGTFGEKVTFIGYPSADKNGSCVYFNNLYAISSKGGNADAAWEFVRKYFTKEAMEDIAYGFPISMSRFDELAKEAMQRPYYIDFDGSKVEYDDEYYMNGESIPITPISEEAVSRLKNFILSVNKLQAYHQDIYPIIEEEAASFFEGEKTAEEVANIIQSRVDIYIKEKQ